MRMRLMREVALWAVLLLFLTPSVIAATAGRDVAQPFFAASTARYSYAIPDAGTQRHMLNLNYDDTAFSRFTFAATQAIGRAEVTVYKLQGEPLQKFVLPRRVYQYVTLESDALDGRLQYGEIDFVVSKAYLEGNNLKPDQMALFYNDGSGWEELETLVLSASAQQQQYRALLSGGLGNFAVGILERYEISAREAAAQAAMEQEPAADTMADDKEPMMTQDIDEPMQEQPVPLAPVTEGMLDGTLVLYAIIGSVALVAILGVSGFYAWQRRPRKNNNQKHLDDVERIMAKVGELKKSVDTPSISDEVDSVHHMLEAIESTKHGAGDNAVGELANHIDDLAPRVLNRFVTHQRKRGLSDEQIQIMLRQTGFDDRSIQQALAS